MCQTNTSTTTKTTTTTTPWWDENYDYGFGYVALHREIEHFYKYMLPTPVERAVRKSLVQRIDEVVKSLWSQATTEVYGSVRMDLFLPTSDIDIVVFNHSDSDPLQALSTELVASGIVQRSQLTIIGTAMVPIINIVDTETKIKLDISFNVKTCTPTVELIKAFKRKYPVLPKLVVVLKQFLQQRNLSKVYKGGLASYSLILMCISFLQMYPRQNSLKNPNLGVLLIEFLELYGSKFDYCEHGISITGEGRYFPKKQLHHHNGFQTMMLCIEDPLLKGKNVSSGSFAFQMVQVEFEYASWNLMLALDPHTSTGTAKLKTSILGIILSIEKDVINYRKWLNSKFSYMSTMHSRERPQRYYISCVPSRSSVGQNQVSYENKNKNGQGIITTSNSESQA